MSRPVIGRKVHLSGIILLFSMHALVIYFGGSFRPGPTLPGLLDSVGTSLLMILVILYIQSVTSQDPSAWYNRLMVWLPLSGLLLWAVMFVSNRNEMGTADSVVLIVADLVLAYIVLQYLVILYLKSMLASGSVKLFLNQQKGRSGLVMLVGLFVLWLSLLVQTAVGRDGVSTMFQKPIHAWVALFIFLAGYLEVRERKDRKIRQRSERHISSSSELVQRLKRLIEDDRVFTDCEVTLDSLAERMDMAPFEMTRLLHREMHTSFYALVNRYRVEEVKKKLSAPDTRHYTLLAIAYECGFNSKSTFNRVFKEHTGVTPSAYLEQQAHSIRTSDGAARGS